MNCNVENGEPIVKSAKEELSALGEVIDSDIELFKKSIIEGNYPIGIVNSLSLKLQFSYKELIDRKNAIIAMCNKEDCTQNTKQECITAISMIYIELAKIEAKVTFLNERAKELVDVG